MWLDDLRDLAYDVEDILDEFATEALRRKLVMPTHDDHHQGASSSTGKRRKNEDYLIPALYSFLDNRSRKFVKTMLT
ncbi:hypothetical protein Q3G72_003823 [Acer saccharum]|nr:hypothetical protein Q3G72_003823 [Acer saccharum]